MSNADPSKGSIVIEPEVLSVKDVLGALADPVRLEMLRRAHAAGGTAACSHLYEGISRSTASHHFSVLRRAGLVISTPQGPGRTVSLAVSGLPPAVRRIVEATLAALPRDSTPCQ